MNEKTRISFNKIVVTASELSFIESSVKTLSNLAPSDAIVILEFDKLDDCYTGRVKVSSPATVNFEDRIEGTSLVSLMKELAEMTMVRIDLWKKHRFDAETQNLTEN